MDPKTEWLFTRKQQIIAELTDCEAKSRELFASLARDSDSKTREIEALREAIKRSEAHEKEEIGKCSMQLKTYENLIVAKEDTIAELR